MDAFEGLLLQYGLAAIFLITLVKAAGAPLPPPTDAIMLFAAGAASRGTIPLWQAVSAIMLALVLGGLLQFALVRGPGRGILARYGKHLGLGPARLDVAKSLVQRSGPIGIALAVFTPGARVASVAACGIADVPMRTFLPGLVLGNAGVVLTHFLLGYAGSALLPLLGPSAVIWALVIFFLGAGIVAWLIIQSKRNPGASRGEVVAEALEAWEEAACPACLIIGAARKIDRIRLEGIDKPSAPRPATK